MKSHVLSPLHALRRHVDHYLSLILPPPTSDDILSTLSRPSTASHSAADPFPAGKVSRWTSLYHMVTFRPDVGYAEAKRREAWQKEAVTDAVKFVGVAAMVGGVWLVGGKRLEGVWRGMRG